MLVSNGRTMQAAIVTCWAARVLSSALAPLLELLVDDGEALAVDVLEDPLDPLTTSKARWPPTVHRPWKLTKAPLVVSYMSGKGSLFLPLKANWNIEFKNTSSRVLVDVETAAWNASHSESV